LIQDRHSGGVARSDGEFRGSDYFFLPELAALAAVACCFFLSAVVALVAF